MPEPFGTQDTEGESLTDFLGVKAPLALQSSPALPTAGPVVGGAAPASMGGGGTVAPAAEGGGAATRTGSKAGAPSDVVQRALQALKMGDKAARAIGSIRSPDTVASSDILEDAPAGKPQLERARASAPAPTGPPAVTVPSSDILEGIPSGMPDFGLARASAPAPPGPLTVPTSDILEAQGGGAVEGAAAAPGTEFASELGAYAPYVAAALAAAQTGPALAARAETSMPAMEQALLAGTEVFGHVAAPFTFGMSEGATAVLDPLITDMFGKPHKTKAQSAALGNRDLNTSYSTLLQDLQSAQTPEELAAAFSQVEGEGYRDNKMPYPTAQGFDVRDQGALLSAINSGDPEALNFLWQGGGSQEAVGGANTALNNAVRQQVALMKAAQAGDPQAQALMQERLAAKQAREAKAFETSGMNPEFQRLASEAMQQQWAQGYGGGGGGGGAGAP